MKKFPGLVAIAILIMNYSQITHADLFDDSMVRFGMGQRIDPHAFIDTLDINGDSYSDILITTTDITRDDFYVALNLHEPRFIYGIRSAVIPQTEILTDIHSMKYAIAPSLYNRDGGEKMDCVLLAADGGSMELIKYIDDLDVEPWDRYNAYSYNLSDAEMDSANPFAHIHYVGQGDAAIKAEYLKNDLFVVSDDGTQTRLFLFRSPFIFLTKEAQSLSPSKTYGLPGIPSRFWIGDIDKNDETKDDIFFEYGGNWYIWIADKSYDSYSQYHTYNSIIFTIPTGVTKINHILEGVNGYDLLISVDSEPPKRPRLYRIQERPNIA